MPQSIPKKESQSLRQTRKGERVRVERIEGQPAVCHRLREMGFCETAVVQVLNNSGALLCQVCGARVCLSSKLAESIFVAPA
jgi:ferrous iron transport protein A